MVDIISNGYLKDKNGKVMELRVKTADEVDFDIDQPVKSSAVWKSFMALRGGGRNLFVGTQDFSGDNWNYALPEWTDAGETFEGLSVRMKSTAWGGVSQPVQLKAGLEYTLSAWVKRSEGAKVVFFGENTNRNDTSVNYMTGTDWQRVHMTFSINEDGECTPRFENTVEGETMYICGLMFERSNIPSDWAPAPEEIARQKDVNKLSNEIADIKNSIDGGEDDGIGRVSGTVVATRDAMAKAPLSLKVYGRTTQDGTPSVDNPIAPANSNINGLFLYRRGKNLVNVPDTKLTAGDKHDLEVLFKANDGAILGNTYTVSFRVKAANVQTAKLRLVVYDSSKNIIADSGAQSITEGYWHLTVNGTTQINKVYCYLGAATDGDTITISEMQVELGNHATSYDPYDTARSTHLWAAMPGGLAGVPVTSGGNYTDENGQEWACDMVDLTNGILERRCATIESYAGESIPGAYMSSTGALTTGATVVYVLDEPVTSNLAASVVNEYNAINFPAPCMTLYSNGMAWVDLEYERDAEVENEAEKETAASFDPTMWGMPMLWLYGDTAGMNKDDAVTLNWRYKDMEGECTCKWQGSSSIWFDKKNYTIKFDQSFEVVEGWGAQTKYCFKANYIDHSHARNICCAKLWGQVTKNRDVVPAHFADLVNGGAIDGFPCIIMLNDEFHGLYTWNIPKDGWMMGMGNGEREAIVCADPSTDEDKVRTGFRATISALDEEFSLEYCPDENDTGWIVESLNTLITACMNSDGTDLDTTVAQYLDWDSAIDSYIFTVLISGHDNVVRNYLLATYDGVKWFFVQYDMDETFGQIGSGLNFKSSFSPNFDTNTRWHRVYELIKLYKKDELKARYEELRNGVMSEMNVHGVVGNFVNQIPPAVLMADLEKYPTIPSANASNMAQMLHYYGLTVDAADKAIEAL